MVGFAAEQREFRPFGKVKKHFATYGRGTGIGRV